MSRMDKPIKSHAFTVIWAASLPLSLEARILRFPLEASMIILLRLLQKLAYNLLREPANTFVAFCHFTGTELAGRDKTVI